MYFITCFLDRSLFFFNLQTAYDIRISDWSSDVCSSDLLLVELEVDAVQDQRVTELAAREVHRGAIGRDFARWRRWRRRRRGRFDRHHCDRLADRFRWWCFFGAKRIAEAELDRVRAITRAQLRVGLVP